MTGRGSSSCLGGDTATLLTLITVEAWCTAFSSPLSTPIANSMESRPGNINETVYMLLI